MVTPAASDAPAALRSFYVQRLKWSDCGQGFSCSRLTVPRDYAAPEGGTVALALVRSLARDPGRRIGSLVVNPGGPGASGIDYARSGSDVASDQIRARYDIVGFDPRGIGRSEPVDCGSDVLKTRLLEGASSPQGAAAIAARVRENKQFARACDASSTALLPHMSTVDTARDLDVLRSALGDPTLSYLGKSYGTYLGAVYAGLFPGHVGHLVLDGAVDPAQGGRASDLDQARGFEQALRSFVRYCANDAACPVSDDTDTAVGQVRTLLRELRDKPIPALPGRKLDQAQATIGVVSALYDSERGWPALVTALSEAARGRGAFLLSLADEYNSRSSKGTYRDNQFEANAAVSCLDRDYRPSVAQIQRNADQFAAAAPTFGRDLAWSELTCTSWPVPPVAHPHAIAAAGAAPILAVGTTGDPATPVAAAKDLAGELRSGRLLLWDGDGHTAYRRGSSCVDTKVDAYLLGGRAEISARCTL